MTALRIAVSMILMNAATDLRTTDLDLDNAYEHANRVYAASVQHVCGALLRAWFDGAMQFATEEPALNPPTSRHTYEERIAFWCGSQGKIPAYMRG